MKYYSLLILFIIISLNVSIAQTNNQQDLSIISGKIKEVYTNTPISYVTVKIKDTNLETTSNDSGFYMLKNVKPGVYSLQVSMIGYEQLNEDSIRIDSAKSYNLDITLSDIWECHKYVDSAKADIKNKKVKILIAGLIVNDPMISDDEIKEITKKYGFEYEYVGCTFTCSDEYNKIIEQYLNERNGEDWKIKFNEDIKMLEESYFTK